MKGSDSMAWRSSWMRRSASAAAGSSVAHPGAHRLQGGQLFPVAAVGVVAREVVGEVVEAGEGGGEDDAGVVAHRLRQPPPVGQLGAQRRGLVVHDQRDPGVAQCVEAGTDREPGGGVERGVAGSVDAELADRVERRAAAGEFDDVRLAVYRLEGRLTGGTLDQAGDVPVDHFSAQPVRDRVDELLAVEDAGDVLVVKDPLDSGKAERRAGDHHGFGSGGRRRLGGAGAGPGCGVHSDVRPGRRGGGPARRTARRSWRSTRPRPVPKCSLMRSLGRRGIP